MGRPYESELSELGQTYAWSMAASAESLAGSLAEALRLPLIAVGSGGSLTSASVAAILHMRFTGLVARVMTPYDLAMSPLSLKETGVLLCTAGGSNPDVLSCFEGLVRREPGFWRQSALGGILRLRRSHRLTAGHSATSSLHLSEKMASSQRTRFLQQLCCSFGRMSTSFPCPRHYPFTLTTSCILACSLHSFSAALKTKPGHSVAVAP